MEKELQQKLEEIAFRLERLSDDYHDLLKEITELDNVEESKKVLYEQHKTKVDYNTCNGWYTLKSRLINQCSCLNYVSKKDDSIFNHYYHYPYIDNNDSIAISTATSLIIETYIPSKNIVLVVEL